VQIDVVQTYVYILFLCVRRQSRPAPFKDAPANGGGDDHTAQWVNYANFLSKNCSSVFWKIFH